MKRSVRGVLIASCVLAALFQSCTGPGDSPPKNPSPIEVVTANLDARKNNDAKAWRSTFTEDHDFPDDIELGVLSLTIEEVKDETNPKYPEEFLKSEKTAENGWTKENIAFVSARYEVQHDDTLVPNDNGTMDMVYALVRKDSRSPWLIEDWGWRRY